MRIAVGQLSQETNTLNPLPTVRRQFEEFGAYVGAEVVERMAETSELGGFIQHLRTWPERPEIVGLARFMAWPCGPLTADTFPWLRDTLLAQITGPLDGVLLSLHGALVAENEPDVSGAVLAAMRAALGPKVPLVATLDLHANVTRRMVEAADALVLFHTAPHLDVFETGTRAAVVLRRILIDGAQPVTVFRKVPAVFPAERANTQDPSSVSYAFRERLQELERRSDILAAGLATVQPWLDIPDLGSAVVVVGDGLAPDTVADGLARDLWARRHDYVPDLVSVAEGVKAAFDNPAGLVVLSDSADATTSGAAGDGTHLLREMLKYDWPRPALVTLVAPEAVGEAERRGIGASWRATLGGVRDTRFSQPIDVSVTVERLFDARFVLSGHLAKNLPIDMGRSAVLRGPGNVRIVITERNGPHFAPELFRAAGLEPFDAALLVAKSPCGFRAAYQERARRILVVRAPGCAPSDFQNYGFQRIPRPLWPWDEAVPGW